MDRSGNVSLPMLFLIVVFVALIGLVGWQLLSDEQAPPVDDPTVVETPEDSPPPTGEEEKPGPITTKVDTKAVDIDNPDGLRAPPPLRPEAGVATEIAGFVHGSDRKPIPGATIILFRYVTDRSNEKLRTVQQFREVPHGSTTTAIDGQYKFEGLTPNEIYYVRASAPNHISQIKDGVRVGKLADFSLAAGSRVIGKVVDAETGEPIEGAFVKAWYATQNQRSLHRSFRWEEKLYTKADGSFEIAGAPHRKVKWLLYHDKYEDTVIDELVKSGITNEMTFPMLRGLDVRGVVTNKLTDEPIANALVQTATGLLPEKKVRTDENGVFQITGLKRGQQAFSFQRAGFTSVREMYEISSADGWKEAESNFLRFRLDPAGQAAGIVLNAEGVPVDNAQVFVARKLPIFTQVRAPAGATGFGQPEMLTGADGQFIVTDLGTDMEWRVIVMKDGVGYGVSEDIQVGPAELREGITVRMIAGGEIEGRVLDENGVPLENAEVAIEIPPFRDAFFGPGAEIGAGGNRTLTTGLDGSFKLDRLWAGTFTFSINHPGHIGLENQKIILRENDERVSREFRLRIGRSIEGICAIQGAGELKDVEVTISRPFAPQPIAVVKCDENGAYRFDALTRGIYSVQAKLPGFSSELREEVSADSRDVNLTLMPNGGLIGSVVGASGAPVPEFSLAVAPFYGDKPEAIMRGHQEALPTKSFADPGGRFYYEDLAPGRYVVTVRARGQFSPATVSDILVASGSPTDLGSINLTNGGTLRGLLISTNGEGLTEATVRAEMIQTESGAAPRGGGKLTGLSKAGDEGAGGGSDGGGSAFGEFVASARPTRTGEWEITGLSPGRYRVSVVSARHVLPQPVEVTIANDQEVRQDWTLPVGARVALTVVDDQGVPVVAAVAQAFNAANNQRVRLGGGSPRSNTSGLLELAGLAPGTYRITLSRSGYLVTETRVTVTEGQVIRRQETLEKILR